MYYGTVKLTLKYHVSDTSIKTFKVQQKVLSFNFSEIHIRLLSHSKLEHFQGTLQKYIYAHISHNLTHGHPSTRKITNIQGIKFNFLNGN